MLWSPRVWALENEFTERNVSTGEGNNEIEYLRDLSFAMTSEKLGWVKQTDMPRRAVVQSSTTGPILAHVCDPPPVGSDDLCYAFAFSHHYSSDLNNMAQKRANIIPETECLARSLKF